MSSTIKDVLYRASDYLKKKSVESHKLDAELILSHLLGRDRVYLYAHPEEIISENVLSEFKKMVKKRGLRTPLAYIVGEKEFFCRHFFVEKGVFCPRPETEILVEEVLKTFPEDKHLKILEIGSGTGVISITVALERRHSKVFACDISRKAVNVTKKNVQKFNIQERVFIFRNQLFDAIKQVKFDCIVSNPPYLSKKDYLEAEAEVRKEPRRALMAREHGMRIIKKIIRASYDYLVDDGWLFIEIGHGQGKKALTLSEQNGYNGSIVYDLAGKERVLKAKKIRSFRGKA